MPRANRYIVPGNIYHLTHRCHDRRFLLKFVCDRHGYRRRLREAVIQAGLPLLDYNITSNHVHLIVYAENTEQVAMFMQQVAGEFARDYNRRKERSGAFWEGRYQATMVDSSEYLWECLNYVELNMVRCHAVDHPQQWPWSGYGELMGLRQRNRLLDMDKVLWLLRTESIEDFRQHLAASLQERIIKNQLKRQPQWTEGLAVGSQSFVEGLKQRVRNRQETETTVEDGAWILRENYGAIFRAENRSMMPFGSHFFCVTR